MMRAVSKNLVGLIALTCSSASMAATVTVTPSSGAGSFLLPFSVTVHGDGFPSTAGATLGLTWNPAVVEVTGVTLAPGSPFTGGLVTSAPWSLISVLGPLVGTLPSGSFDAFTISFRHLGSVGPANIRLVDDQIDLCWADAQTSECVRPVNYVQADVAFCYAMPDGCLMTPIPASAWLLGSALGVLGWMRRKSIS